MIYLDDSFFDHPKVIAAGGEATLLYLHGLAWLKQQRSTDGRIPKGVLSRLAPVLKGRHVSAQPLAARLVDVVLWHDDGTCWTCHDYVVKNAKSIGKSQQSSAAARARWAKEGKRPQIERTSDRNADASTSAVQQSTVHSPQSTVPISSSSNGSSTAPHPDTDDDDPRIRQACQHLAQRDLAQRLADGLGPPRSERAWLEGSARRHHDEHAEAARKLLADTADLTAEALADHLGPEPDDGSAEAAEQARRSDLEANELARKRRESEAFRASPEGQAAEAELLARARRRGGE